LKAVKKNDHNRPGRVRGSKGGQQGRSKGVPPNKISPKDYKLGKTRR